MSWIFSLLLILSIAWSARAESQDLDRFHNMYQIMKYDEIIKLPPAKREKYIQQVRDLFVELEKYDKKRAPSNFMDIFADEEEGLEDLGSLHHVPGFPVLSKDGRVICPGKLPGTSALMVPYRVYPKKEAPPEWRPPEAVAGIYDFMTAMKDGMTGQLGHIQVEKEDPKDFICRDAQQKTHDTGVCENGFVPGLASWSQTLKNGYKENYKYFCFSANSFKNLPDEKQKRIQKAVQDVIAKKKFEEMVDRSFQEATHDFCGNNAQSVNSFPDSPNPKTCNDDVIQAAREKFYKGENSLCIYGGNISLYQDRKAQAGKCRPPNKFCMESILCDNPVTGDKFKPAYECPQGQIICNPLLFGIKEDGKTPFCVGSDKGATSQCQALSEKSPKAVHPFMVYEEKRKNENLQKAQWSKVDGIEEVWNQFAKTFNGLCFTDKHGAEFFCRECHTMKKKLFEINAAARGIETCGQALDYTDAKPRPPKSAKKASGAK